MLNISDCRIDGVSDGDRTLYVRATHIPTGIVVEPQGGDAEKWGAVGRRLLIAALEHEVLRAQRRGEAR